MECRAFEDGRCTRFESPYIGELCPVATVYAALSGYGHLRDRLRKHEDAMEVSTQEEKS